MEQVSFDILISTKNRKPDLIRTLNSLTELIDTANVRCVVYDDGSTDGTSDYINSHFPKVTLFRNEVSKGYLFCRNTMLNQTKADYAISLDDDAHFISEKPLEEIQAFFENNPNCGLIAFRIFWGLEEPIQTISDEKVEQVRGFVGCGHVWRMKAWKSIPNYPEWFQFFGEEAFSAFHLFKKDWQIHYLPSVLVHHRVNVTERKKHADYRSRLRRSIRSRWYLYFLFYPWNVIPRKLLYTLWMQVKFKTLKGDVKATLAIIQALFDVLINFPKLLRQSKRFSKEEFVQFERLSDVKIFWIPRRKSAQK
jgi:glycosyltransferase involved in cell wall biosynthesis